MFSTAEIFIWLSALFILVVLPILLYQWSRMRLLKHLQTHWPGSYAKLSHTQEVDYDTKTVLWLPRDWSYYLESAQDNHDPQVRDLKKRILWCRKYFKGLIVALIIVGAVFFLLVLVAAGGACLKYFI